MTSAELFEHCKAAGIDIGYHESDLYIPVNEITQALIAQYDFKSSVIPFISQIDGMRWYDVPFAYLPFWKGSAVRTEFVYPPIPIRSFDWAAWIDGHEESMSGHGESEQAAIDDLMRQLSECE